MTTDRPCIPWMAVIDEYMQLFGFEPGGHVYLSINFDTRKISITPDYGDMQRMKAGRGAEC